MNAVLRSRVYQRLAARLCDSQGAPRVPKPQHTFPARLPMLRIDHVFVSLSIEVIRASTLRGPIARVASDHLPLMVEFQIRRSQERHLGDSRRTVLAGS